MNADDSTAVAYVAQGDEIRQKAKEVKRIIREVARMLQDIETRVADNWANLLPSFDPTIQFNYLSEALGTATESYESCRARLDELSEATGVVHEEDVPIVENKEQDIWSVDVEIPKANPGMDSDKTGCEKEDDSVISTEDLVA